MSVTQQETPVRSAEDIESSEIASRFFANIDEKRLSAPAYIGYFCLLEDDEAEHDAPGTHEKRRRNLLSAVLELARHPDSNCAPPDEARLADDTRVILVSAASGNALVEYTHRGAVDKRTVFTNPEAMNDDVTGYLYMVETPESVARLAATAAVQV